MVLLTEYPKTSLEEKAGLSETKIYSWTHKKSSYRNPMLEILRGYKEAFINSKTISVRILHDLRKSYRIQNNLIESY